MAKAGVIRQVQPICALVPAPRSRATYCLSLSSRSLSHPFKSFMARRPLSRCLFPHRARAIEIGRCIHPSSQAYFRPPSSSPLTNVAEKLEIMSASYVGRMSSITGKVTTSLF